MKTLILVRYGQYEDGHLTQEGVMTMNAATNRLHSFIEGKKVRLVSAATPRASESAEVISSVIKTSVETYEELYAAEEEGKIPNCRIASKLVSDLGDDVDVIVAVVSREYIESLPAYILGNDIQTSLDRGECLVIDYDTKSILYLRD